MCDRSLLTGKVVPAIQDWGHHAERQEGRAVLGAAPQDLSWDPEFSGERLSCQQTPACQPAGLPN